MVKTPQKLPRLLIRAIAVILTCLVSLSALAQTNKPSATTNWGTPACGAQLSIALSNNILALDKKNTLNVWIKNNSSNEVGIPTWTGWRNLYVVLTNSSGSFYELTSNPDTVIFRSQMSGSVGAEGTMEFQIALDLKSDIKPGNYKLLAKRKILVEGKVCELVANVSEVTVTAPSPPK